MSHFAPAPEPKSELGRYRVLSPSCGLRVSPLCLGGASFGEAWQDIMGKMSKEETFALLDTFYDNGGNFIDTANSYQDGESEMWIGEWLKKRGNRDEMVIATKYTTGYQPKAGIKVNYQGNHAKSMITSMDASLKKLGVDYIDIFYVHWWDHTTSIEEIMIGLNNLVRSGKVLYLGISDTPAWIVSECNRYAKDHALSPFVIYQGKWNVASRDFEREIIPMARAHGMALAPWSAVGGGKFQSQKDLEARAKAGQGFRAAGAQEQTPDEAKISQALEKVGKELGTESVTAVALAYVMQKTPYVFPIIGGRKTSHLLANIEALSLTLSPEQIAYLEGVVAFDVGFPLNMIGEDPHTNGGQLTRPMNVIAKYSWVAGQQAIKPANL